MCKLLERSNYENTLSGKQLLSYLPRQELTFDIAEAQNS